MDFFFRKVIQILRYAKVLQAHAFLDRKLVSCSVYFDTTGAVRVMPRQVGPYMV